MSKPSKNFSAAPMPQMRGDANKRKPSKVRVLVFGTFDIVHKGHDSFFRQARKLTARPYLIVSIARDVNVKRIKAKKPINNEKRRLANMKKHPLVDAAVLGALNDYIGHIVELKPAIIALGYDQSAYTGHLREKLSEKGLKVKIRRLKPYHPSKYKTSLLSKKH